MMEMPAGFFFSLSALSFSCQRIVRLKTRLIINSLFIHYRLYSSSVPIQTSSAFMYIPLFLFIFLMIIGFYLLVPVLMPASKFPCRYCSGEKQTEKKKELTKGCLNLFPKIRSRIFDKIIPL